MGAVNNKPEDAANNDETPVDIAPSDDVEVTPTLSAEDWKAHLAKLTIKDLLRVLQEDKARAGRFFTGFRPSGDSVRHPLVVGRVVEEAIKLPKFAKTLLDIAPPPEKTIPDAPKTKAANPAAREIENLRKEVQILRDSLEKRKKAVMEREMELRESRAILLATEREWDTARQMTEQAKATLLQTQEENERLRHRLHRAEQPRPEVKPTPEKETKKPVIVSVPSPSPTLASQRAAALSDGLRRLLQRARFASVVEVCRDALLSSAARENAVVRGELHTFYAIALFGLGQTTQAEEQYRFAMTALLDGGDVVSAAESLSRLLAEGNTVRKSDAEIAKRLTGLAKRFGKEEAVRDIFTRLNLRSRTGWQRLQQILGSSAKEWTLSVVSGDAEIAPDQVVILPAYNAVPLTPRRIAKAVAAGEVALVGKVRQGIALLQEQDAPRADALLRAVATIHAPFIEPLLREGGPVVVDASNVARFNPDPLSLTETTRLSHLLQMRDYLLRSGYFPVLMIADANLGYYVDDRSGYGKLLAEDVLREVPGNTSADDDIIAQARLQNAPVVSNDTFSDRADTGDLTLLAFHLVGERIGLFPRR